MSVLPVYREFDPIERMGAQGAESFEQIRQQRCNQPRTAIRPRCRWTISDQQLQRLYDWLRRAACNCDFYLKAAVVLIALYLLVEIGSAFLPGGSVERVLGGAK
jgi:hypothetical protein